MNNIGLIIAREYITRVRRKSFIIMTILAPLLFGGFIFVVSWSASSSIETKNIQVVDDSGLFESVFVDSDDTKFYYMSNSLEMGKEAIINGRYDGLLYIPELDVNKPEGIVFYASSNPSISMLHGLSRKISGEIENLKLNQLGIDKSLLEGLKTNVDIGTINLSGSGGETGSSSVGATAVGYIGAFLIYMFIFVYGAQSMRGVVEEKNSRIVEVIISSVKPFHLMMGKVIGIAGVGLTQFILWIVLTVSVGTVGGGIYASKSLESRKDAIEQMGISADDVTQELENNVMSELTGALEGINFPLIIGSFLFFFLSGYLLYGALFAAIGSAVDSDTDAQQFMLPVTLPLISAIVMLSAVINDPNGTLAFWLSIIPLTSPVIMMMRVPFGVPGWELALSMVLMVGGFVVAIWIASRIYRIGILIHGTKVNYKVLFKWFMMKG